MVIECFHKAVKNALFYFSILWFGNTSHSFSHQYIFYITRLKLLFVQVDLE